MDDSLFQMPTCNIPHQTVNCQLFSIKKDFCRDSRGMRDPIKDLVRKLYKEGKTASETVEETSRVFGDTAPSINTVYMWRRLFRGGGGERTPAQRKRKIFKNTQRFCDVCQKDMSTRMYLEYHMINSHNIFIGENKKVYEYMEIMDSTDIESCVFNCDVCNSEFTALGELRTHKLNTHRQKMRIPKLKNFSKWISTSEKWEEDDEEVEEEQEEEIDEMMVGNEADIPSTHNNSANVNNVAKISNEVNNNPLLDDDGHEEQFMTIMKDGRIESDEYFPKRGRGRPRGLKNIKQSSLIMENLTTTAAQLAAVKKEYSDDYINNIQNVDNINNEEKNLTSEHSLNNEFKCCYCDRNLVNMTEKNAHLLEVHLSELAKETLLKGNFINTTMDDVKKRKTFSEAGPSFLGAAQTRDAEQQDQRSISPQINVPFAVPSFNKDRVYAPQDDSASFSVSMADSLRLMNPATREYAKMRIQQVIYECAYGKYNTSGPPSFESSAATNESHQTFSKGTSH